MAHTIPKASLVEHLNKIESETVRAACIAALHPYSSLDQLTKRYRIDRATLTAQRSRVRRGVYATKMHGKEE